MKESPFAQIPTAERIATNCSAFAIWDRFPVTPGHALVIPNRLISAWWEASDEEQVDLLHLLREVRILIEEKYEPDGFNIGINVGEAAGQTINHLHLHLNSNFVLILLHLQNHQLQKKYYGGYHLLRHL